ncbi:hypothetical protein CI1B_10650 [Bradyrhizobium ivorense]|uniref:Caspase family p20 domain-containing protein n=2 Tax=Bradyrhizobium ivorense TaxID=2511166 RepID=A0A508SWR8_9BRAD|nr:hypothetical protein CI1B_10650 [Bradyrhizobium ivorense]
MLRTAFLATILLLAPLISAHAGGARIALVVGVSNYLHAPRLANTLNDANDVSAMLKRLGFDVETMLDPTRSDLEAAVRRYGNRSLNAEISMFYYSGHALELGGRNWLLPAPVNLNGERDLRFEAVELNTILEQTDGVAKASILVLDACRDNPFASRLSATTRNLVSRGLARIDTPVSGTLLVYSTTPGQIALDGATKNSPFTTALLRHIETPRLEVKAILTRVTKDVVEETKGRQRPWYNSSLEGDLYFAPEPSSPAVAENASNLEGMFWDSIKSSSNPADFNAYLAKFPNGLFAELAKNRLLALAPQISEATPEIRVAQGPQAVLVPRY